VNRKRRTRQHVIEEMGVNFLERQVLRRGHQLQRPSLREYGCDATMFHFAANGEIEDGEVRFQIKATDVIRRIHDGRSVVCRVETAHVRYWYWQTIPFVLVQYDAASNRGYWVHLQPYVDSHARLLSRQRKSVSLHLPVSNVLTVRAIDRFRQISLDIADRRRKVR